MATRSSRGIKPSLGINDAELGVSPPVPTLPSNVNQGASPPVAPKPAPTSVKPDKPPVQTPKLSQSSDE